MSDATTGRGGWVLTALAFVAFISLGLPDAVLGVSWKVMREVFGRPLDDVGWILLAGTGAYLLSSFFAGQMLSRVGVGWLLVGSCGLVTAGLWGNAVLPGSGGLAGGWWWLIPCAAVGGLGAGAIDAGLNAYGANHFSPRVMNWLHACWGIGATTGPAVMTAAVMQQSLMPGDGWRVGYGVLGVVLAVLTVLFVVTRKRWDMGSGPEAGGEPGISVWRAMGQGGVWMQAGVFFVYCGIEASVGQLLLTLLAEGRGFSVAAAGYTVAAYWAALTVGRIGFGQVAAQVPAGRILWIAVAGVMLAAGALWVNGWLGGGMWLDVSAAVLLGVMLAPVFPTYMSITPERLGKAVAAHAVGLQVSAAAVGIMVFPWLIAGLTRADAFGVRAETIAGALVVLSGGLIVMHGACMSRAWR